VVAARALRSRGGQLTLWIPLEKQPLQAPETRAMLQRAAIRLDGVADALLAAGDPPGEIVNVPNGGCSTPSFRRANQGEPGHDVNWRTTLIANTPGMTQNAPASRARATAAAAGSHW
jgi:hypothetical protein